MEYRVVRIDNELYHHGIKGQKWGVRRFQKKDGTLTSAGKKRYDDDNLPESNVLSGVKKSSRQTKLEEKYRSEGMTEKEAALAATKRVKAEKYVATAIAVTGLTVAACAAVYAHNKYAVDQTLSKSTEFQRIMHFKPGDQMHEGPMYMAYDKRDKIKYQGMLGKTFQDRGKNDGKEVMNFVIRPHEDIKVASPKRAKDTFADLYRNNAEFREAVKKSNQEMGAGLIGAQGDLYRKAINKSGSLKNKDLKTIGYDAFNVGLVNKSDSGKKAADIFYDALRKQGVNAVQDVNDKKYSGYRGKNPIIMFGGKYDYSGKVMSNEQIANSLKKATNDLMRAELIESGTKFVVKAGAGLAVATGISTIANRNAVKQYRKEHPDSKLTDKQILDNLYNTD